MNPYIMNVKNFLFTMQFFQMKYNVRTRINEAFS